MSLDVLRERHLDAYDVTLGIVEPDEAAAFSIIPNAQLAARLCSAYNDWLLERWLEEEPRLRGMIVVPAQYPEAAAREIERVGGRDEFVGVFLPGAARIPYGNPTYDPLWAAANELGLPVAVHTHYEGVGIAPPITAAGMPDTYAEYHTLCGSGMYGHFVSILCHGIFERFPDTRVAMVEGGLVPFVGLLWRLDTNWKACRSEIPWCRRRPSEYVWDHVRFATQPLESPDDPAQLIAAIEFLRPAETLMYASDFPHWDFDEPEQTLRQLPEAWRENVRSAECGGSSSGCPLSRPPDVRRAARHACPRATPPKRAASCCSTSRTTASASTGSRERCYALADRCPHRGAPLCAGKVATPIVAGADGLRARSRAQHRALPLAQVGVRHRDGALRSSTTGCGCGATRCGSTATRSWSAIDRRRDLP